MVRLCNGSNSESSRIEAAPSLSNCVSTVLTQLFLVMEVLKNSCDLMNLAREHGYTIIHAPISFEPGHDEIADSAYGILAGVKEGNAFTRGEWGADFSGKV